MEKTVSFYREDNKWYADITGHTKEDNEMIWGSDCFLSILASESIVEGSDRITMTLSDESVPCLYQLVRTDHDSDGARYLVIPNGADVSDNYPSAWICNVTHDIFGEHPEMIYIKTYKVSNSRYQ